MNDKIKGIFLKDYETRTQTQHKSVVQFIQPYFPTLAINTVKLITFYIHVIQNSDQIDRQNDKKYDNGILIKIYNQQNDSTYKNPQANNEYLIIKNQKININSNEGYGLFINYQEYLSCLSLGQTTIQDEIAFFNASQYLCSMPKKKYFNILRNSKVLTYSFHQSIYFEGQMISSGQSGSGVFLVRHGELSYLKNIKGKNVQVFRFGSGHLLGSIQLENKDKKRLFTVKSKSSRCVVYQLNQQFFNSFIKPYCQKVIQKKQKKLQKFLGQKAFEVTQFRQSQPSLSLNLRRSFSNKNEMSKISQKNESVNMFTSRDLPSLIKTTRLSAQIEQQQLRKTSYMGLKYQGALKNYPMASQRAKSTTSEFKDFQKLVEKNDKINKIRSIKKNESLDSKEEILFDMFQNSWKFDKLRRKRNSLIF